MWRHYRGRLYIRMLWPSHLPPTLTGNLLVFDLGHHMLLQFLKDKQINPDMGCFVLTLYEGHPIKNETFFIIRKSVCVFN